MYFNCLNINNILAAHFDGKQDVSFTVNRDIFGAIIGDMMFNTDDEEFFSTR